MELRSLYLRFLPKETNLGVLVLDFCLPSVIRPAFFDCQGVRMKEAEILLSVKDNSALAGVVGRDGLYSLQFFKKLGLLLLKRSRA